MTLGVVPDEELSRPRKFTTAGLKRVADPWLDAASSLDSFSVSEALIEIGTGTWASNGREWVRDVFNLNDFHVLARTNLVITIRLSREYPGFVQLIRIGAFLP